MPIALLGFVALAAVGGAVLLPKFLAASAKADTAARCRHLQARIAGARLQGGDAVEAARLEAELRACIADANAQGANIDPSIVEVGSCDAMQAQIDAEWTHYKSTAGEDAVKRNMTRGTILRLGEDMARCLDRALLLATSVEGVDAVIASAQRGIDRSVERALCFFGGVGGCSRYGWNEQHPADSGRDDLLRVAYPLGASIAAIPGRERETSDTDAVRNAAGGVIGRARARRAELQGEADARANAAVAASRRGVIFRPGTPLRLS